MKKTIILLVLVLITFYSNSQQILIKQFEKTFGGSSSEQLLSMEQTSDGGYILIGHTSSYGAGGVDIYLVKTDASGTQMWAKTFGGTGNDNGYSVQQTVDEGYIITGITNSFGAGSNDVYLIKTDANGDTLWTKTFGNTASEEGRSVKQTSDGGYIITGLAVNSYAVYLIKTDSNGILQWQRSIDILVWEAGTCVQVADGGYIITGITYGAGNAFLLKTDALGNTLWVKYDYLITGYSIGRTVMQTSDGGYIFTGSVCGTRWDACDIFLIKTDSVGNMLWQKTFGGPLNDFGYSLHILPDGGFLLGCGTLNYGAGNSDLLFIRTDSNGNEIRKGTAGGPNEDGGGNNISGGVSAILSTDGGYVLAGMTKSYGAGSGDFYLVKQMEFSNLIPTIAGRVYFDTDSNCVFNDTIDLPIKNRMIQATDGPYFVYTDNNGNYNLRVPDGNYNVAQTSLTNDIFIGTTCPNSPQLYNVSVSGSNLVTEKNFFNKLSKSTCDVSVIIQNPPNYPPPYSAPCPNMIYDYNIIFTNNGLPISNPSYSVTVDPILTIQSATCSCCVSTPPTIDYSTNTVTFSPPPPNSFNPSDPPCLLTVTVLVPPECPAFPLCVAPPFPTPTTFNTTAFIHGKCQGDTNFHSDAVPLQEIVACSSDPNDKLLVTPTGCGPFGNISGDEPLTYQIRFQNTGNAPAHNIVLKDILDANFDISTFKIISASHPITRVELFPSNTLMISFLGIELPDSGSNLADSHGFVIFSINPLTNLSDGTTITNEAAIYFDFNDPVITNSTYNTIRDVLQPVTLPSYNNICLNDSAFTLTGGNPVGGTYSGVGVSNGKFNPSQAGVGTHLITYSYAAQITESNYSLNRSGFYAPVQGTGTRVYLGDDQVSSAISISFNFNFYGSDYTNIYISSNGFITFNADFNSACCSGLFLPHHQASPSNLIAFAWYDLFPPGNGSVEYFTTGTAPARKFIINFNNIPICCNSVPMVSTQIILYEGTNIIEIQSGFIEVSAGTMGIVNNGGTLATVVSGRNSAAYSITNDFVQFIPPAASSECSNIANSAITVNPTPTVTISPNGATSFCEGNSVILTAVITGSIPSTYHWSNGANSPTITVSTTGIYTVTVYDVCGTIASTPVSVTVNPKPIATVTLNGSTSLCPGDNVILTVSTADSYLWSNSLTTQSITVNTTGLYTVTVTTNACSAVSEPVNITVNNVPCGKDKILICHIPPSNQGNPQTLCINKNALQAHKAHGDYCGPCNIDAKTAKNNDWCGWNKEDNNQFSKDTLYCWPAERNANIPNDSTLFKHFSLLIVVVDSNTYGVTQENVDFMMFGVNNYYAPWKIGFCYSTIFIDASMVSQYPQNPDSVFNVIISDWPNLGLSGNPIKIDYSVVINNNYQGYYSLAHELGHDFNLAHTFSVSEYPPSDPYMGCSYYYRDRVEYSFSRQDSVGDAISDTPPTPRNTNCAPPVGVDSCSAGNPSWPAWGYENLMGYSYCLNATFSPQQAGRMHCFINHGYEGFRAYGTLHCNPLGIVNNSAEVKRIYFEIIPNPFKESTTINFKVQEEGIVSIEVYNYLGQKITDLFNEKVSKEQQKKIEFFTNNLSSGIYYAKLKSNNKIMIKKMMITK